MHIQEHEIHIWPVDLSRTLDQETEGLELLSPDERERAQRFRFPIHRQRFIASHCILRKILGRYLSITPGEILFAYDEHEKPYLPNHQQLQFNLSHTENTAVYAFSLNHPVGVDIEKIQENYNPALAKRFFSEQENTELANLPGNESTIGFYRIWSRKEAILKAAGKGLTVPLNSFSVSVKDIQETINLENKNWSLLPLTIHKDYQSAVATDQLVNKITYCDFFDLIIFNTI